MKSTDLQRLMAPAIEAIREEMKREILTAIHKAYNSTDVNDLAYMTSWEVRDLCTDAVNAVKP